VPTRETAPGGRDQAAPAPRKSGGRAPRKTVSHEVIVSTALRLMDSQGPDSVTIRSLAEELGVGAMTLYTYFRSKDELFDAVRNHVLGLFQPPPADGPWEDRVREILRGLHRLLIEHPSLIQLIARRPLAGHEPLEITEAHLRALCDAGFDGPTAAQVHIALIYYLLGSGMWEVQRITEAHDPEQRREFRAAVEALSPRQYPTVVELADALAHTASDPDQFAFGLDLLIAALRQRLGDT
jgi:AcrR family transcriptional regulator